MFFSGQPMVYFQGIGKRAEGSEHGNRGNQAQDSVPSEAFRVWSNVFSRRRFDCSRPAPSGSHGVGCSHRSGIAALEPFVCPEVYAQWKTIGSLLPGRDKTLGHEHVARIGGDSAHSAPRGIAYLATGPWSR